MKIMIGPLKKTCLHIRVPGKNSQIFLEIPGGIVGILEIYSTVGLP